MAERRVIELTAGEGSLPGGRFLAKYARADYVLAGVASFVAFLVYLLTLAPTVTAGDSGELAAAAWTLGIPHPPGYPLYTIVAKVFATLLPFGEVAYRLNLLSAVLAAVAVGLVVLLCRRLSAPRGGSLAAGLACAFSPLLWSQATITEVYALSAVVFLAVVHMVILYLLKPTPERLLVLAWLTGLALTAHPSLVLLLPGVLAAVIRRDPVTMRRPFELLSALGFFVLGFSIYLYLPIRSLADPVMDWGNPETFGGFMDHILRAQYAGMSKPPENPFTDRVLYLGHLALFEVGAVTTVLACLGLRRLLAFPGPGYWPRERQGAQRGFRSAYLLWSVCFSLGLLFVLTVSFEKHKLALNAVFFIPLLLLLAPATALGLSLGAFKLRALISGPYGRGLEYATLGLLPACLLIGNYHQQDKSRYTIARDYAESIFKTLPEDSVYIPGSDHSNFPLLYLQLVEGRRADVVIADKYGYLDPSYLRRLCDTEAEVERIRRMPRKEADRWLIDRAGRPVFVNSKRSILEIAPDAFEPVGVLYRVDRERKPLSQEAQEGLWASYRFRNLTEDYTWRGPGRDVGADFIAGDISFLRAACHFQYGEDAQAIERLESIARAGGGYKELLQNVASLLAENDHPKEASRFYEAALELDPDYAPCRRNYAWVLLSEDLNRKKAIALGERSLEELEPDAALLHALGDAYRKERRYRNARDAYLAASRMDATDWEASRLAGEVLEEDLERPRLARRHFEESLRRKPTQPELIEKLHGEKARRRYEAAAERALDGIVEKNLPQIPGAVGPAGR